MQGSNGVKTGQSAARRKPSGKAAAERKPKWRLLKPCASQAGSSACPLGEWAWDFLLPAHPSVGRCVHRAARVWRNQPQWQQQLPQLQKLQGYERMRSPGGSQAAAGGWAAGAGRTVPHWVVPGEPSRRRGSPRPQRSRRP